MRKNRYKLEAIIMMMILPAIIVVGILVGLVYTFLNS